MPDIVRKNRDRIGWTKDIPCYPDTEILPAAPAAALTGKTRIKDHGGKNRWIGMNKMFNPAPERGDVHE